MNPIEIRQLELGPMANFVYLLADPTTHQAFVIDPGWSVGDIRRILDQEQWKLTGIMLTHHHFDHVNGVGDVLKFADVPIYIHRQDAPEIDPSWQKNIKALDGGESLDLGQLRLQFLHTPGHTEGSLCLQVADRILTGDTLFIRGCGRVDLSHSDPEKMYQSLKKISTLDDRTMVLPGHNYGPAVTSSLQEEKAENPYLQIANQAPLQEFLRIVGG